MATSPNRSTSTARQNHRRPNRKQGLPLRNRRKLSELSGPPHFFNKRVGEQRVDNGQYHNQGVISPFSLTNAYFNYTIRNHSIFDQTKIQLSGNNLLDSHNLTSVSLTGAAPTQTIPGTTYTDPFTTNGPTPVAGGDNVGFLPGRSFSVSVTFGLAPRGR